MSKSQVRAAGRGVKPYPSNRIHRSTLALGVALALSAGGLQAQEAGTGAADAGAVELETVTVKGVRGSVMRAQEIKQEAAQIVDSVTAEDIGALPDRSVTETLKRVSGVTVTGFLARDDTDHFSAEGSGVMIRGLTFVRGELNGRDVFSANGGRGLSFEEVPSELMAGVDVYKNPSAEIIEGGLGGTVNLRTRMPFDQPGRKIAGSVDYNYGDHAKKGKPSASFLFSDRWQTGIGEVGFLANVSYSEMSTLSDGIQIEPFHRRGVLPENGGDWAMMPDGSWVSPEDLRDQLVGDSGHDAVFVPGGANWRQTAFDRKRQGIALAAQWRPNDDTELYAQFLTSKYRMAWREHSMVFGGASDAENADGKTTDVLPMPGTDFVYDENGRFVSGTLRSGEYPWHQMYNGFGIQFSTGHRYNTQDNQTTDLSAGFRHYLTDNLVMRGDFQYVKSDNQAMDFTVYASTLLEGVNLDLSGKYPTVTTNNDEALLDPSTYFWRAAMDHIADNRGNERAGRIDLEYTFDDSDWLRFFRFGVRLADRSYTSYSTKWNWKAISESWHAVDNPDRGNVAWLDQYYAGDTELYDMGNFFGGKVSVPTNLWFPAASMVNIAYANSTIGPLSNEVSPGSGWSPLTYAPENINIQDERTQAAYGVLYFENQDALGVPVDGNLGVRVVKTSVKTTGGGQMPDLSGWGDQVTDAVKEKFAGQFFSTDTSSSYTDVLPSLNVRFRFGEGLQWRLAASKAISRPEFRLMQAWLPLSVSVSTACSNAIETGARTEPCGFEDLTSFEGSAGNPALKPMRANQYDTALEWYFGPTNMVYATLFYKDVKDYFATTVGYETWNGDQYAITRTNNLDEGKIRGYELGYSQFFDFLPGWLSGFGVQANFTYVDSSGGANAVVDPYDLEHRAVSVDLPLEGLSKRSYNVVGIYEKNKLSFRLAYNWRSRYLLTSSDVITQLPTWNEDFGQLDGSFFYNLNSNIQIGLQVNNITNSVTHLTTGPRLYPTDGYLDTTTYDRAWFMNDRRYSAVLRASW
ncbi:TonB-dependent receptor [Pseudoxanthomonas jiangsuensis]|uniref:TonB-dependent receptor n=1 Tax=Pseudoxanthomonas jiangsuensis TaxID=619688 RepID=UPI001391DF85|nr:TonB-dependent receptor [Pseudoxanthomonas jiangsuensis]KAF1692951.1 TonB-dependent receptor [Pseudoxanthomonas jiangsuensis]